MCPECGYYFRGIQANSSVQRLSMMLHNAQQEVKQRIEERKRNSGKKGFLLGLFDTIEFLDSDREEADVLSNIIITFPVPTTKEDLLEFILYLEPKTHEKLFSNTSELQYRLSKAYKKKYEECRKKALVFFPDDPTVMKALGIRR